MAHNQIDVSSSSLAELPFGPASVLLGAGALVLYGLTRRSKLGFALAAAGGLLAYKVKSGASPSSPDVAKARFLLNSTPERAYELWRNFDNLTRFMAHLKSVRALGGNRSEWIAQGPLDREVRWTAEVTEDTPNHRIAWRSLPGSDVQTSGSVQFEADPQGRGTFVTAKVEYSNPGGALGRAFLAFLGKHPEFMVREDLRRFKALLEAGEAPTTVGQTHGPRGVHGHTEQVLFRETTNHPQPQAA